MRSLDVVASVIESLSEAARGCLSSKPRSVGAASSWGGVDDGAPLADRMLVGGRLPTRCTCRATHVENVPTRNGLLAYAALDCLFGCLVLRGQSLTTRWKHSRYLGALENQVALDLFKSHSFCELGQSSCKSRAKTKGKVSNAAAKSSFPPQKDSRKTSAQAKAVKRWSDLPESDERRNSSGCLGGKEWDDRRALDVDPLLERIAAELMDRESPP